MDRPGAWDARAPWRGPVQVQRGDVTDLSQGDEFAGHRIDGVAGRGGMGVVYRARQLDLDRTVALKLIAPSLAEDEAFRTRFIAESRAAAGIDHPNVIPVFYAGEADGRLYIAMRFVDGEDLRSRVRREGRLDPATAAHVVAQVAAALDAAHARGLVHRDVKPANVLLGDHDHAYLTDFGLTKRVNSATGATKAGGWVGTLGYVSPEQIRGERIDARADVYALGCVLYHALTGSTPFQRDTDEATLWAHLNEPAPSVMSAVPDLPPGFEAVVTRALSKDPAERFQSAGDLGRAALAAAGRADAREPERVVATGPAAPPRPGDETVVSPEHAETVQATDALRRRRRRARPAGGVLVGGVVTAVLLAGGATALVLGGGDDTGGGGSTATSTATTARRAPATAGRIVGAPAAAGFHPNAIVATNRYVWALSGASDRVALFSARTGRRSGSSPRVGAGATAVTAGFGRVWVAKGNTRAVVAYGTADPRRKGASVVLSYGRPVAITARSGAVWVGSRGPRNTATEPATFTKIDPDGGVQQTTTLQNGLQNLAVGEGGVWVIDGRRSGVTRYDIRTGRPGATIRTGQGAYAVAVGEGSVWVSNEDRDTVTQIDPDTRRVRRHIRVGRAPHGLDVGGGAVWVANRFGDSVTRIDARTGRVVGRPVRFGANAEPFAVSVHGQTAWVTLLGGDAVARVAFR